MSPLKEIYCDAIDGHNWDLLDPFSRFKKVITKQVKEDVQVFTFGEWIMIPEERFWSYSPAAEFSVLTGLRLSELAGLREKIDIKRDEIQIRYSIVRKRVKDQLKTVGK
jgi:hypothetical protein